MSNRGESQNGCHTLSACLSFLDYSAFVWLVWCAFHEKSPAITLIEFVGRFDEETEFYFCFHFDINPLTFGVFGNVRQVRRALRSWTCVGERDVISFEKSNIENRYEVVMAKIHCHSLLSGSSWSAFGQETLLEEEEGEERKFFSDFLWYLCAELH